MNFNHIELLFPVIIVGIAFLYGFYKYKEKFFKWVQDHWDYQESGLFKFSEIAFFISIISLLFLVLDPRGTARKVKANIQNQKTIIMIDTSSSMLVEDVRPNRLGKAVMLAKHFVKNAIGQQIAIMVFSDMNKKIVPFTSDIDLLEARLNSLEDLRINAGGTALQLSIQEALQYLKTDKDTEPSGNILVFTDAEENELKANIDIPQNISLALVGVGTAKGGVIPIRDSKGVFKTNKKYKGELVISKLDEDSLKKISEEVPTGRYWIASNYSVPTTSIINFFARSQKEREQRGQVLIKPILTLPFFIIFFTFFIFSSLLKFKKPFVVSFLLIFVSMVKAQDETPIEEPKTNIEKIAELEEKNEQGSLTKQEKEQYQILKDIVDLEDRLQKGELGPEEKKDLAYLYLRNKEVQKSGKLYNEVTVDPNEISTRFNKYKSLLLNKKFKEGLEGLTDLKNDIKDKPEMSDILKKINSEILTHIKRAEEQKKQEKEQKKKQQQENEKKKSGSSGQGESDKDKDKKDSEKDQKDKNKNEDKKNGDQKNKSKSDDQQKPDDQQKNSRSKQRMKIKQLPALLKQLMSEDRNLQKEFIDTSTEKLGNGSRDKKDW